MHLFPGILDPCLLFLLLSSWLLVARRFAFTWDPRLRDLCVLLPLQFILIPAIPSIFKGGVVSRVHICSCVNT